jgi:hypothetical protein
MPTNIGTVAPNPSAPYPSLLAQMRTDSPPTLPYTISDCDPADVANLIFMPVGTHIVTARGHAVVNNTDKHS